MKKSLLFCTCLLLITQVTFLQAQKKTFTLQETILQAAKFSPRSMPNMHWIKDSDQYAWVNRDGEQPRLMAGPAMKGEAKALFALSDLNDALAAAGREALPNLPTLTPLSSSSCWYWQASEVIVYDWVAKKTIVKFDFPENAQNQEFSGQMLAAFTIENDVYVSTGGSESKQITSDGKTGIVNGKSVHRDEFGIHNGLFWSPDGKKLAFYRMDETMVTDYGIYDLSQRPATNNSVKYPMAGAKSHHVQVGVYDLASGKTIWLNTGTPDEHYLTNVTWNPEGTMIFMAEINRGQDHVKMNQYDANSGALIKTLFEEKHGKYIQPKNGPLFIPNRKGEFLWQSERDGYNHLYHYDANGQLLGQITKGQWVVTQVHGFNPEGSALYYVSTQESPVERHLYVYEMKSKKTTKLTSGTGVHTTFMNSSCKYFIDHWQNRSVPRHIQVFDVKGTAGVLILDAKNPLEEYQTGEVKLFTIKAADGATDLWCRMFMPTDFDPSKKYPVLVYVYNGPNIQMNLDGWNAGGSLWMRWMASQGWIVFTVDGRGSANRGLAFEQAIFRDLGTAEIADQLKGVEYLKEQSYVDGSRLAIYGWSYGGFMTTSIMLRAPEVFDAGVAGGPVIDWHMYEVMYTERYMDTPEENPEGYKHSCTLEYVKNLKGKLMLIHGTSDDVVLWQHSLVFLEECVKNKVQVDYFVYPGHPHNVVGPDQAHLMEKVLNYVMENTK